MAIGTPLPTQSLPLWPLPLMAALLPTLAALVALFLFNEGREVFCNPFVADCVSISRMARHGLANLLFRLLVIPGAVLQALTWLLAARVLASRGLARRDALAIALLGAGAFWITWWTFCRALQVPPDYFVSYSIRFRLGTAARAGRRRGPGRDRRSHRIR